MSDDIELIMRKARRSTGKSEETTSSQPIDNVLAELRQRVEKLEQIVFFNLGNDLPFSESRRGRGRPTKVPVSDLIKRRDALVLWIEENWPEVELAIRKARNAEDLHASLKRARGSGTHPFQPLFYHQPEKYLQQLWAFLCSDRYHGNPRDIAGAMAGMPELSWKRSFDICGGHKCATFKHPRAYRDYLKKKFPQRFRELLAAKNAEEVIGILKRSRTKDQHYLALSQNSARVLTWLEAGLPGKQNVRVY
jgi:hypothetical protein